MKRIILIGLLFLSIILMTGVYNLAQTLFVSTIHFKYEKDKYQITLFCPSSFSVGKTESTPDDSATILSVDGDSISQAFNNAENSSEIEINYRHIVSVIFDESFLKEEYIKEFNEFIIENKRIDFNFYIFSSKTDPKELFSFKNPEKISSFYSILNVSAKSDYLFKYCKPLHYVDFLRGVNKKRYSLKIPYLDVKKDYTIEDEETNNIYLSSMLIYQDKIMKIYNSTEYNELTYLNEFEYGRLYLSDQNCVIQKLSYKIKRQENIKVIISCDYETMIEFSETELKKHILDNAKLAYKEIRESQIDFYNINDINEKYNKNYSLDEIEFEVKLKKI